MQTPLAAHPIATPNPVPLPVRPMCPSGMGHAKRKKRILALSSPLPGVRISLPLIAALGATEAPVSGHRLFAVVAQASRLKSLVWLPGIGQAGLALLFFSECRLI